MCGIIGQVANDSIVVADFIRQRDMMIHRGPDDGGIWISDDCKVALGSRRLAIQDLSNAGHMPMQIESGAVQIVFNGEIFNFRSLRKQLEGNGHSFKSSGDTEVVLKAYLQWGERCVAMLNGQFAFLIYDDRLNSPEQSPILFGARDRVGEKPFYFWEHEGGIAIASELKSFTEMPHFPRKIDVDALNHYLAYGYVPGSMCMFKDVKKLPAGHTFRYTIQSSKLSIKRYWEPPRNLSSSLATPQEYVEKLQALLTESVRLRLLADVPVGILLSGGLDSSLITAVAASVSTQPIKTFTIALPGANHYNEAPYARKVASYFGTEHHELNAEPASVELLPKLAKIFDEPLGDSSIVPTYLVSQLTRKHVTVALGGDGGDELFGGYRRYNMAFKKERRAKRIPDVVRKVISKGALSILPVGYPGRRYLGGVSGSLMDIAIHDTMYLDSCSRKWLYNPSLQERLKDSLEAPLQYKRLKLDSNSDTRIGQMTMLDFETYFADDILVKVDRASMAVSLEARAPWLDNDLIDFAFGAVPPDLKANETHRKHILKLLGKNILPPDLDLNRKQGFSIPVADWFDGEWGDFISGTLLDSSSAILNKASLEKLIKGQRRGYSNSSRLFALTMLELWRKEYDATL